jgi:hypothetical protein
MANSDPSRRLSRMRIRVSFLLLAFLLPFARATSVVPPSFAELVGDAEAIYRGRITAVESRWVAQAEGQGNVIKTFVTLAVERALKGTDQKEVTLEFLGGTVGGESMSVSGMPKFKVGDREIVFVQKNGIQFCPLVALMHGRYRVLKDDATAREHVARDDGLPLTAVNDVETPMVTLPDSVRAAAAASARARALTPDAFEASITSEIQRPTPRVRTN